MSDPVSSAAVPDVTAQQLSARYVRAKTPTAKYAVFEQALALVERLEARERELREALEHYAAEENWTETTLPPSINTAGYLAFEYDGRDELPWAVARAALAVADTPAGENK